MLISDLGTLVRTRVDEVTSQSRNTQGVTLIKLAKGETLVGLERVQEPSGLDEDDAEEPLDAEAVVAEAAEGTADAVDDASAVEESGSEE